MIKFEYLLKGKLAENGLTLAKLSEMLGVIPQNLSQKLKRGSTSYDEAQHIADLLGYDIEWIKRK